MIKAFGPLEPRGRGLTEKLGPSRVGAIFVAAVADHVSERVMGMCAALAHATPLGRFRTTYEMAT